MNAGKIPKVMKWIGYLTAILALIAGVRETANVISDRVEAHRTVTLLLSEENVQLHNGDYWSAGKVHYSHEVEQRLHEGLNLPHVSPEKDTR